MSATLRGLFGALLSLVAAMAGAQDVKVERFRLANGLTVILHEDRSVPRATINTWFYVGSKDEPERRSGFAHLFEHLMFMGTKRVPDSQFDRIMEAGGGSNNATTSKDRTNYFSSGPSNLLETLLWLDADRLEDLSQYMDQRKLDLQREVVRNERREGVEMAPYGRAYEAMNALLYPKGHPYHTSVIGSHEDLEAARVNDVKDFFDRFYVPSNASLVVAGDFDSKLIRPRIEALFGTLRRGDDIERKPVPDATFRAVKRLTMTDKVPLAKVIMAWHSPAAYRPGDAEMKLSAAILAGGFTSRLYQRLVVERKLATEVSAYQDSQLLGSVFNLEATASEGVDLAELEREIDAVVATFVRTGPTPGELARQVAGAEKGILSSLQSIEAKADKLNEYQFYFGEPNSFARELDLYRKATPKSVAGVSRRALDPNARLIIRVIPEIERPEENPRDKRPEVAPEAAYTPASPSTFKLSNGITVQYWLRPELPLVSLAAGFPRGREGDGLAKAGLTSLAADLIWAGSGKLDAQAFAAAMEQLGADYGSDVGLRTSTATLSAMARNFPAALDLFATALRTPTFAPTEWERLQRETLARLAQAAEEPTAIAGLVANREYYGAEHPLGVPASGTKGSVSTLTIDQLKSAAAQTFRPEGMVIFAAGSLSQEELTARLEKAFGAWTATAPLAAAPSQAYAAPKTQALRVVIVDRPDSAQTVIRFTMPGVPQSDPSRLAYEALGTVLGGTFTSRLNANLREDKGYTYGIGASYSFGPQSGVLTARTSVRADVTGPALKEILAELRRLATGDVSEEEGRKARSTMRVSLIENFASLSGIVSLAEELWRYGQPWTRVADDLTAIPALPTSDLNRLAKTAIPLDRALLVLVGDRQLIERQLEGLGLPKPEIIAPEREPEGARR